MKSGRGMPPLFTTRSWILRSIWRMLSTSRAHAVAQPLDLARREADLHQLGRNLLLQLEVLRRLVAFLLQHDEHAREELADRRRSARARRPSAARGSRAAIAPASSSSSSLFDSSSSSSIASSCSLKSIRPSTRSSILSSSLLDLVGEVEDLRDRHRARRDRHDHVLQAFLDPLGDLDFAFARQELDRAHLAHVHAHRVGRAAEFGVERRYRGFGGFSRRRRRARSARRSDISSVSASGASS